MKAGAPQLGKGKTVVVVVVMVVVVRSVVVVEEWWQASCLTPYSKV